MAKAPLSTSEDHCNPCRNRKRSRGLPPGDRNEDSADTTAAMGCRSENRGPWSCPRENVACLAIRLRRRIPILSRRISVATAAGVRCSRRRPANPCVRFQQSPRQARLLRRMMPEFRTLIQCTSCLELNRGYLPRADNPECGTDRQGWSKRTLACIGPGRRPVPQNEGHRGLLLRSRGYERLVNCDYYISNLRRNGRALIIPTVKTRRDLPWRTRLAFRVTVFGSPVSSSPSILRGARVA